MNKKIIKSKFTATALTLLLTFAWQGTGFASAATEVITIDANSPSTAFPHFWEHMFGSGRAILSLRESYRTDLRAVKSVTDLKYVRFHNIFHDEVGLYNEDADGKPFYNFTYIDQIYDGLLANGVRPFIELSFMPSKLAAKQTAHVFWYHPIVSPPADWARWRGLITAFTKHLIDRYGVDEVSKWYFEVWNEPNLDFWAGVPAEPTYYQLYDETAKAIKGVDTHLRVGGPSTAQAAWVDRFIKHCVDEKVPVDFVSTHVYGNDTADNVLHKKIDIPRSDMVSAAVAMVHQQVKESARPDLPIIWSEYNAAYDNEVTVTDSPFMGPWLANNIRLCDGLADEMSLWTFSDVFEEQGVQKKAFYGGFGLIGQDYIPKASFNAIKLLHQLGEERIKVNAQSALVTKRRNGSLAVAVWNYTPEHDQGTAKDFKLEISGLKSTASQARVQVVDADHGSALKAWQQMGKPDFPSREQQKTLREAARSILVSQYPLEGSATKTLSFTLQPRALSLVEIEP